MENSFFILRGLFMPKSKLILFILISLLFLLISGNASPAVSQIAAGKWHTIAINTDGTLWAWGDNRYGQLGNDTTSDRSFPVQIGTGKNWASVAAGSAHTVGIKTDGTLWAWGNNMFGQLGNGTLYKLSPIEILLEATAIPAEQAELKAVAVTCQKLIKAGRNLNIKTIGKNIGGENASSFKIAFYLSLNPDKSLEGDTSIGGKSVSELVKKKTKNIVYLWNVPKTTAKGSYYIKTVWDSENVVNESDENNNIGVSKKIIIK